MPGFFDVLKEAPVPFPGTEAYPLFNRISIETISFCNRSCHFCPVAWNDRGKVHMTDQLFDKISNELGSLEFDGVAQLFLLSEPFIDQTLRAKAQRLREACPDASFYISSNGDVLDRIRSSKGTEAALEVLEKHYEAGINVVNINIYDAGPEQAERYRSFAAEAAAKLRARPTEHKYRHHSPRSRHLCITDMRFDEREREGKSKGTDLFYIRNKQDRDAFRLDKKTAPQTHCMRTQRHIVALFDGRVPICCAIDPNDSSLLVGDLNTQSLLDVWNSEVFFKYRYFTQQAKRVLPGCDTCTHKMAFPHVVRKVAPTEESVQRWREDAGLV